MMVISDWHSIITFYMEDTVSYSIVAQRDHIYFISACS